MSLTFFLILAIAYFIQNTAMSAWFKRRFGRAENFITANAPNDAQRFFGLSIYITMLYYVPVAIYLATGFNFWGLLSTVSLLNTPLWQVTGLALGLVALLLMTLARLNLGSSWRVGLDYHTTDALVTTGFYRAIRNPYFTFFLFYQFALVLAAPNAVSLGAFIQTVILLNLQARFEETFLTEKYGDSYLTYKQVTGRFLPKLTR